MMLHRHTRIAIAVLFAALPTLALAPETAASQAEQSDAWRLACAETGEGEPRRCQLRSALVTQTNANIARIVIGKTTAKDGSDFWYMNAFMPLGLHIPTGVGYRIDGARPVPLMLQDCDTRGCRAMTRLSREQIRQLKRGLTMKLIFADSRSRKGIGLDFSLIGFTKAMEAFEANT